MGYLGEVHPLVADTYGIGEKTYIAVIDILDILEFAGFDHKYTGIAKYPAVTRDLSMVVPKNVLAGDIENMLEQRGGKILESYQLFDVSKERRSKPDINPWHTLLCSAIMTELWKKRILPL